MSEARSKFYDALAKAQGEIDAAKRDSKNPFFKSKYADLASVREACRDQLSKHGIGILQFPDFDPEKKLVVVETILTHSAGFEKSFRTRLPIGKHDAQGVGSAITYARRYAMMAAIGIAPDDDDGNAAVGSGYNQKTGQRTSASLKKEDAWAKFTAKIDELSEDGPITVQEFWESDSVQAHISSWSLAWREQAQEYVEKKIEELISLDETGK